MTADDHAFLLSCHLAEDLCFSKFKLVRSLGIEGIQVLGLSSGLFLESSVLSLVGLELRIGLDLLNFRLLFDISYHSLSLCTCLVDDLNDFSLNLRLDNSLFTLDLSDKYSAILLSLNDSDFLRGSGSHFELILLDPGTINSGLQVLHLSVIRSLLIRQLLSLLILKGQLLITILLDVILKRVLKLGSLFKGLGEGRINVDICDVAGVEIDTEVVELLIEILDHLLCHLTLQVEDLIQPDTVDEDSNTLINFGK